MVHSQPETLVPSTGHLPPAWGGHQRGHHPPAQLRTDPRSKPNAGSNKALQQMWKTPGLQAPSPLFQMLGLVLQVLAILRCGTPPAPHPGVLVVVGWGLMPQEGSEGLGGSRSGCREQGPEQRSTPSIPSKEGG